MPRTEDQDQQPERPADCLHDCLTPAEKRRAILGDETIAHIHAVVDAAPDPSPELVEELRRILARPGGAVPPPLPTCKAFTFAEAEATFGPGWEAVRRSARPAPRIKPGQTLCGRRLLPLFGMPLPEEPEA
ncbi:hypothetical protein ABZ835_37710 [Streptomyces sp. NPDC047461]|uniref:hypothetical protein n=1 Tax=Streptomyces sp. NPDC047461 TaxID=3155619 RepID=UPI0033C73A8D